MFKNNLNGISGTIKIKWSVAMTTTVRAQQNASRSIRQRAETDYPAPRVLSLNLLIYL
jgi:hypothetical protein